jgi:hypothetical protein
MKTRFLFALIALLIGIGTAQPAQAGALPDLRITTSAAGLGGLYFECDVINGRAYLRYYVSNTGSASSGTFKITLKDSAGAIKQSITSPSFSPGSIAIFHHAMENCYYSRTIIIDSTNVVNESDELNNTGRYIGFELLPGGLG